MSTESADVYHASLKALVDAGLHEQASQLALRVAKQSRNAAADAAEAAAAAPPAPLAPPPGADFLTQSQLLKMTKVELDELRATNPQLWHRSLAGLLKGGSR